jgi:hypothetical protein
VQLVGSAVGFAAGTRACGWSFAGLPRDSSLGPGSILGADSLSASFTPDVDGIYYLDLTVSVSGTSVSDRVVVTAEYDLNRPPSVHFESSSDFLCQPGQAISLMPYASDPDKDGITYELSFESQPQGSSLAFSVDPKAYFDSELPARTLSPVVEGSYAVRLTATDAKGAQASALTEFTVKSKKPFGNTSPVANAGPDMSGLQDAESAMDIAGRGADPDGDPLSYSWRCVSYPPCFPASEADALARSGSTLSLTMGLPTGEYVFELTVADGTVQGAGDEPPTATDSMTFRIIDTPAQMYREMTSGFATFGGYGVACGFIMKRDPDISCNPSQNVAFSFLARPAGSATSLDPPGPPEYAGAQSVYWASFIYDMPGRYVVAAVFRDYAHTFTRIVTISVGLAGEGAIDVSIY